MTFTYPAVFTPHKEDAGFHVNFRIWSTVWRMDRFEDAVENARYAAYNWFLGEFEEGTYDFPSQSHYDDITLEQGSFIKYIMVTVKPMPDND